MFTRLPGTAPSLSIAALPKRTLAKRRPNPLELPPPIVFDAAAGEAAVRHLTESQDSVLELEFVVPSHWLEWIKAGASFEVRIGDTGQRYLARMQRRGARIDPVSQSIKLSAAIDGKFPELIFGMSGRVELRPPAWH